MLAKTIPLTVMAFLSLSVSVLGAEPVSGLGKSVEQIKRFAPDDCDLLFVVRPKQLMASTFFKTAMSVNPGQVNYYPKQVEQIELILALTSTSEVFPQPPPQPIGDESHPALHSISSSYAGLIRFDAPISVTTLTDWFAQQPERLGLEAYFEKLEFRKDNWNGHEVYHCGQASIPAIHQLDPRTFVVAESQLLRKRLENPGHRNTPIDAWLEASRLSGDLVIAADLSSIDPASAPLRAGVPLENVKSAGVRLDFSGPELLALRCQLNKADHAQELLQTFESYRELGITSAKLQSERAETDAEKWLVGQAVPLLRSFDIRVQQSAVNVELPRPKNWDQLMAKFAENVIETRKRYEAQMKEAISNLETTKVLIAKRQLARGETINAQDILVEEWPSDRVPQTAFETAAEVIGSKAKREIFPGEPLLSSNILPKSATVPVAKP